MKITENFSLYELQESNTATRRGLNNNCPNALLDNMRKVATRLELIRANFNVPLRVISCYRSKAVNKACGGSKTSAHTQALAADVKCATVSILELCKWAAKNITDYDQIIYEFGESGWMHIGFSNGTPRKQCLSATKEGGKTVYKNGFV